MPVDSSLIPVCCQCQVKSWHVTDKKIRLLPVLVFLIQFIVMASSVCYQMRNCDASLMSVECQSNSSVLSERIFRKGYNSICNKFGLDGPWVLMNEICVWRCRPLSKMAARDSDWLRHFPLLLKNHCVDYRQICHKSSSHGPALVLLLFVVIGNPRWPPWTLIGWDIFDFFSRTIVCTGTKLATNVPLMVLH